jgi:alpha(1,3/1,4) fucosyltransferase
MTRKILLQYPGDIENALFDPSARDNCTEPFIRLRSAVEALGYVIESPTRESLKDAEWLLFWDVPSATNAQGFRGALRRMRQGMAERTRNWLEEARTAGLDRVGVILWEPATVCAANWMTDGYRSFTTVISWDDSIVDNVKIHKICFPVPESWPRISEVAFRDKKLLVNISSNKLSRHPGELYSARVEAIRYFESSNPYGFDLYGQGWDRPAVPVGDARGLQPIWLRKHTPYPSYRGTVAHKTAVLPNYRFALCYENAGGQAGYITEKIFDVMRSGCVPVYLGAPNIEEYVDRGAFIDRRKFSSNRELGEFLSSMTEAEHESYLRSISRFLDSDRFSRFKSGAFAERMISILGL